MPISPRRRARVERFTSPIAFRTGGASNRANREIRHGRMSGLEMASEFPDPLALRRAMRSRNYQSRFRGLRIGAIYTSHRSNVAKSVNIRGDGATAREFARGLAAMWLGP